MFAVYGVYGMILEICAFLSRGAHVVFALRTTPHETPGHASERAGRASACAQEYRRAETYPVLLCPDAESAGRMEATGYEIYVKYDPSERDQT